MDEPKKLCSYCGQKEAVIVKEVYINGEWRKLEFCSEECAAHAQMSAEG